MKTFSLGSAAQKIDITHRSPEDLQAFIHSLFATPKELIDRAAELFPALAD